MKACAWLLCAGLAAGAVEPPLPAWSEDDRKSLEEGELVPGQVLLSEEIPDLPAAASGVPAPSENEAAEESASPEVAETYLEGYFGGRPASYLSDPQELLGTKERRDREEFLKYHAGDSAIDLFVYLFDGHQEIPSEVREEEVVERFFSTGKPAVVVWYYLGAPEKSVIYVSPVLGDSVSAAEQRRALSSSVEEAMEKPDRIGQLEAFCVQLSIRIYWMERAAGLIREGPPVMAVRRKKPEPVKTESAAERRVEAWAAEYGAAAGILGGAVLIVALGLGVARRRARYLFPVFDVPPRLGGAHAAGIGAVISFGSTTQSPSSQRNEVPDYLGL